MERLCMMYTNFNICGVLLFPWMPEWIQDVIRASTFLILLAVSTVWFSDNVIEVYHDLVDSFTPDGLIIPDSIKTEIAIACDIALHIIPCMVLGLPHYVISLFIAYGILVLYYTMSYHRLSSIYSPKCSFDQGMVVAGIVGAMTAIWLGSISFFV